MRAGIRSLLAVAVGSLTIGESPAQVRGVPSTPSRPGAIGLPNPLSDPAFNWWYHNAPTYTRDGATYVVPPPWQTGRSGYPNAFWPYPSPPPWWNPNMGRYPYPYYSPMYGGSTVLNTGTGAVPYPVPATSPVTGQPLKPGDILVKLPTADAKIDLNGTALSGTGTDRHLTVSGVQVGQRHQYVVTASWTEDGKKVTTKRIVYLDGTGHGVADFTRPEGW